MLTFQAPSVCCAASAICPLQWTILLPWFDCFVMDNVRDRLPDSVARHPLAQRMALLLSITWATALTVMAVASLVPAVADVPAGNMGLMIILCAYVFGIGPIIVANIVQVGWAIVTVGCLWACQRDLLARAPMCGTC
jgi:hypothetical protein